MTPDYISARLSALKIERDTLERRWDQCDSTGDYRKQYHIERQMKKVDNEVADLNKLSETFNESSDSLEKQNIQNKTNN